MEVGVEVVLGAFASLSAAIVALWRLEINNQKECREDLKETRELREKDTEEIKSLIGKMEHLQGEQKGFLAGADMMSQTVVAEIRSLKIMAGEGEE